MCGVKPKIQSLIAGILGTLQSLVFIAINITPCLYYFDAISNDNSIGKWFNAQFVESFKSGLKAMLISQTAVNVIWLLSSLTLIASNYTRVACAVRQWVVVTTLVIICSFICCSYYIAQAIPSISNPLTTSNASEVATIQPEVTTIQTTSILRASETSATASYWKANSTVFSYFLIALSNGAIVLWILNILLAIMVHKRARQITDQSKIKPGIASNGETQPKVLAHESDYDYDRPTMNDEDMRETSLSRLQMPHQDPIPHNYPYGGSPSPVRQDSPYTSRSNGFRNREEGDRPHFNRQPYENESYHDKFGLPPNMDDSGASDSNFVFKRKSVYDYENNAAEIENRMAKIDSSHGVRRQELSPRSDIERLDSFRREEQSKLQRNYSGRRQAQPWMDRHDLTPSHEPIAPLSKRVERIESMTRADNQTKLNPKIYQPTAFEPAARNSISPPVGQQQFTRVPGSGRDNNGYLSGEDHVRDSQRRLRPTPEGRPYHSDRESNSRPTSPRNLSVVHRDRMPQYDNPAYIDPRDEGPTPTRSPVRNQNYQQHRRNFGDHESPRRSEYEERRFDNHREGGYEGQGYKVPRARY